MYHIIQVPMQSIKNKRKHRKKKQQKFQALLISFIHNFHSRIYKKNEELLPWNS